MKPYVVQTMDDREQAEFILKRIHSLINDDGVSANEIAILYRSHFLALEMQPLGVNLSEMNLHGEMTNDEWNPNDE